MAHQLVEALSDEFDPTKYHDEYREQLLALIDKKAAGEEIVATEPVEAPAKVLDLMAALEASLQRAGTKAGKTPRTLRTTSPRPAPKRKRAPRKKSA